MAKLVKIAEFVKYEKLANSTKLAVIPKSANLTELALFQIW